MRKPLAYLALILGASLFVVACASAPKAPEAAKAAPAAPAKAEPAAAAAAAPAAAEPAGKTLDVPKGTPAVDGEMDAAYNACAVIKTEAKTLGGTAVYGEARLIWDEKFLYAYVIVLDPVLSAKNANAWEQDSVEFVIDQNNGKSKGYQGDDAQYRVNFKGVKTAGAGANTSLFQGVAKIVDGGYAIEVAIPLHKVPGAAGNQVGFDFQVNEDNGSGSRSAIRCWSDTTNTNYQSTINFGTLTLK